MAEEEKLLLKIIKHICYSCTGPIIIRYNEFVVNTLKGAISGTKVVGRPLLQYLKQVARNTEVDSYTAMKRMDCSNFRFNATNQSKH
jgi:hypothetical protein